MRTPLAAIAVTVAVAPASLAGPTSPTLELELQPTKLTLSPEASSLAVRVRAGLFGSASDVGFGPANLIGTITDTDANSLITLDGPASPPSGSPELIISPTGLMPIPNGHNVDVFVGPSPAGETYGANSRDEWVIYTLSVTDFTPREFDLTLTVTVTSRINSYAESSGGEFLVDDFDFLPQNPASTTTITFTVLPTPGALATAGLALAIAGRRGRRPQR